MLLSFNLQSIGENSEAENVAFLFIIIFFIMSL